MWKVRDGNIIHHEIEKKISGEMICFYLFINIESVHFFIERSRKKIGEILNEKSRETRNDSTDMKKLIKIQRSIDILTEQLK